MIIQSKHGIFLQKQLVQVKYELLEVELTENHLWLIFKNYYKAEKSLPCLFCHFNSTIDLGFYPVALGR